MKKIFLSFIVLLSILVLVGCNLGTKGGNSATLHRFQRTGLPTAGDASNINVRNVNVPLNSTAAAGESASIDIVYSDKDSTSTFKDLRIISSLEPEKTVILTAGASNDGYQLSIINNYISEDEYYVSMILQLPPISEQTTVNYTLLDINLNQETIQPKMFSRITSNIVSIDYVKKYRQRRTILRNYRRGGL